jgi:hypothetical protein
LDEGESAGSKLELELTMDPLEPNDHTSAERLAEVVVHRTDCDPQLAIGWIDLTDQPADADLVDKRDVVARALVRLRRGAAAPRAPSIDLRDQQRAEAERRS